MAEAADDKEQLLPGLQGSVPDDRMGLGRAGEMGDTHLGQGDFLPVSPDGNLRGQVWPVLKKS